MECWDKGQQSAASMSGRRLGRADQVRGILSQEGTEILLASAVWWNRCQSSTRTRTILTPWRFVANKLNGSRSCWKTWLYGENSSSVANSSIQNPRGASTGSAVNVAVMTIERKCMLDMYN